MCRYLLLGYPLIPLSQEVGRQEEEEEDIMKKCARATFQRLMVLEDLRGKVCIGYLDGPHHHWKSTFMTSKLFWTRKGLVYLSIQRNVSSSTVLSQENQLSFIPLIMTAFCESPKLPICYFAGMGYGGNSRISSSFFLYMLSLSWQHVNEKINTNMCTKCKPTARRYISIKTWNRCHCQCWQ